MLIAFDKTLHVPSVVLQLSVQDDNDSNNNNNNISEAGNTVILNSMVLYLLFGAVFFVCSLIRVHWKYGLRLARSSSFIQHSLAPDGFSILFVLEMLCSFACFLFFVAFSIDARTECSLSLSVKFMRVKTA